MPFRSPLQRFVALATIMAVCVLGQRALGATEQTANQKRQGEHVLLGSAAPVSIAAAGRFGKDSDHESTLTTAPVSRLADRATNAEAFALAAGSLQPDVRLDLPPLAPRPPPFVSAIS